jgi:hypothetical protein
MEENLNRNHLRYILSTFVILIAIVACALPGQRTIQPTAAIDPNAIETAIVGTLQAATMAAQAAVTKTPGGLTGTTIEQLQDGTTKYSDYDGGFEVTFPTGWLAVRPNSEEFNASLAKEAAANSMLHDQMAADQTDYDAQFDRLYSYILRPDIKKKALFGFSNLKWDSDDPAPLDSAGMGKLVRDLESAAGGIPGFRADTVQLHEDGEVKMAEIGGHWMMSDGQGGVVPFYTTIIFFKPTNGSTVRMNFTYLEDYHVQISADILSITASVKLLEP